MTKRQSLCICLLVIGVLLLPGCGTIGTWQAYHGEKLPDMKTALIKRGSELGGWRIDGKNIPKEEITNLSSSIVFGIKQTLYSWERNSIRVLPGEHRIAVGSPYQYIIFTVAANKTYILYKQGVGEVEVTTIDDKRQLSGELGYIWMEDESGTVIAGEKPPEDETTKTTRD